MTGPFTVPRMLPQDPTIDNDDDRVPFKPNPTYTVVQNVYCNGSHGIPVVARYVSWGPGYSRSPDPSF